MSVLNTISPITSSSIIITNSTTIEEIDSRILPSSVEAQKQWAATSLSVRKSIISKYIQLLENDEIAGRLAKDITFQMGRPIRYTKGEISTAALRSKVLLDYADEALAVVDVDESSRPTFKKYLTREPLGTVLIIFPWNYPYLCLTNGLVPALLSGNSVIIKPSPQTPNVANEVLKLLTQAGLPENVLQVVHSGDSKTLETLIQRKPISAVVFTGSVEGGLAVQKAAVGRTIPIALELGGNDPAYVRSDVKDIKATAEDIVDGAIFNSGQSCCSIERVYVDSKIYDQFVSDVVDVVKAYKLGDPFDDATQIGPVVSEKAARNVRAQIKDAVDRGAKKLIPSETFANAEKINPTFVGPQVLVDVDETSLAVSTETFGPIIPIIKVSSDEEAVAKMNDSDLGLTASVWTSDLATGEKLGDQIEAGTVFVNRSDYPDPHLAWTGFKNSGRGVSLGPFGFSFFSKLKSHHIKAL